MQINSIINSQGMINNQQRSKTAIEFEAMIFSLFLKQLPIMGSDSEQDSNAQSVWKSLMINEYAMQIAKHKPLNIISKIVEKYEARNH